MANLYALAAADTKAILEDSAGGFGVPMVLTSPSGASQNITGMAADIGQTIDPETGQSISGRRSHVTLPTESLTIGRPVGVPQEAVSPWLVEFQLPSETAPQRFRIFETMPDRLGCIVCFVENWDS